MPLAASVMVQLNPAAQACAASGQDACERERMSQAERLFGEDAAENPGDPRAQVRWLSARIDARPARGGILYELDLRAQRHNLLATLDRRPEAYHAEVLAGPGVARSIIDASQPAKFKEEGLERFVRHDPSRRKMLVDHFWDVEVDPAAVADGTAMERGDFATGAYEAAVRQSDSRVEVVLARAGNAWGIPFTLGKTVALAAGGRTIDIAYRIEGLPPGFRQHLAVEFNFAGMPADASGRCFRDGAGRPLGCRHQGPPAQGGRRNGDRRDPRDRFRRSHRPAGGRP
jgi:alpha-amylase